MKSPQQLAAKLAQQWQSADWRERHLLGEHGAWPLVLPIGPPSTHVFLHDAALLSSHLQQWRHIEQQGWGRVQWQERRYQGSNDVIAVPTHWQLNRPSEWLVAIQQLKAPGHTQIKADYARLGTLLAAIDRRDFQRLLVRRLGQWQHIATADIITAANMALQLEPGCAQGKPLRALAMQGNDSKFFERHAGLLTALLDLRFDKEASRQGLKQFLGADAQTEHWLLVLPLAAGLLPFQRLRLTAQELQHTALPARRIIVVENERCWHQLPTPLPNTIAILGAGLNLGWLAAPWLQACQVVYWGDIDTWGLAMLSTARQHLPHVQALLMDRATLDACAQQATPETVHAAPDAMGHLLAQEKALAAHLTTLPRGRLEQEFIPSNMVVQALSLCFAEGHSAGPAPTRPTPYKEQ